MVPQPSHGPAQGQSKLLGAAAGMVVDLQRRVTAEQGDRTLVGAEPFLDMERLPRALFFILAHTERVLSGMTHGGFGDLVRLGATNVDDGKTQRTPNGRVRAKAVPESVVST